MGRPSNKETLLHAGLRLVHERGFANASVRDIVQAAGAPQGSFINHFGSKENFGVEVLNLYYASGRSLIEETLRNDSLPPMKRLRMWVERSLGSFNQKGEWNGCLLGNLGAEATTQTEIIQRRVGEIFVDLRHHIAYCLKAAVKAGELPAKTKCEDLAGFIHGSMEGAVLQAKAERSSEPTERFKRILFSSVLSPKP
jgi:TetR/AcrR family transcriptional regulator, transcriptional repressor for nem operon